MTPLIFIDGHEGTTGLEIRERLKIRSDLKILQIEEKKKKDPAEKKKIYDQADLIFLCLPDEAAREAVRLIDARKTKIIDPSSAHRCTDFIYGLPEISKGKNSLIKLRESIKTARKVSVPGCHATGFALIINPLINSTMIDPNAIISCWSISGYSGGGKEMIAKFKSGQMKMPIYCQAKSLNDEHKHLPEMQRYSFLSRQPSFASFVIPAYRGMQVGVALQNIDCSFFTPEYVRSELEKDYREEKGRFIRVATAEETQQLGEDIPYPETLNGTNYVEIHVFGKPGKVNLIANFDNLGKGSSGAAVQCMNLMLGLPETTGLI
jgi:N-acetyl-gamma-glutamyl-phosphate reductase